MTQVDPMVDSSVEDARVRSVEQLQLLDSAPEERFEQITRMARAVFGVPLSAVSLLDRDRQWFKAIDGMEIQNVPRPQTICQTTVARAYTQPSDPALIVEDLGQVPEFALLPGVAGEGGVRFYAGYPLYGPGGHPVGTFCIFDVIPRELNAKQRVVFREMAAWAQREIQNSNELERASAVQRQLLPPPLDRVPGYEVAALCLPAFAVGGDFYDHYRWSDGLTVTVADVMGKGLAAAILTASLRSAMRGASRALDSVTPAVQLGEVVRIVGDQMSEDFAETETFATLFHAQLHTATGRVDYVDAGHGLSVLRRGDCTVTPLIGDDLPVGVLTGDDWQTSTVLLDPGDMLVIPSDGLLDLCSEVGDPAHMHQILAATASPQKLCETIRELAAARPPIDDITVVAIRRDDAP
ncbi:PP2C family protein-serine/threonine phosphatase [Rhodococcus erythropolis]|uniref:PP2C family protein-serine/threonine phosphatase n=1 Tax=Rhodococcus erythropolis TaxID=1833 RepID=UPI001BEAAA46|nr:SpoIIE family protein phosphatase [Rhodococcus erythropolis]MBT2264368.1 SpoIIE family protein phosphatase [Rhodococcus erythropolis]